MTTSAWLVLALALGVGKAPTPHQTATVELRSGQVRTLEGYRLAAWTTNDGYARTLWVAETLGHGRLLYAIDADSVNAYGIESRKEIPR